MKKTILALALLICSFYAFSQSQSQSEFKLKSKLKSFKISGRLISEEEKIPLESATVYLKRVKDSSLVTYTISDSKGQFVLENKTTLKEVNLFVSYIRGFDFFLS